jgi:hypothetical protein
MNMHAHRAEPALALNYTPYVCMQTVTVIHCTQAELEASGILRSSSNGSSGSSAAAPMPAAAQVPKSGLLLSRPRRGFGAPLTLVDAPAAELWASNTMEARPFKDANYDLRKSQLEAAVQAVPRLQEAAVQVGLQPGWFCCDGCMRMHVPQHRKDAVGNIIS